MLVLKKPSINILRTKEEENALSAADFSGTRNKSWKGLIAKSTKGKLKPFDYFPFLFTEKQILGLWKFPTFKTNKSRPAKLTNGKNIFQKPNISYCNNISTWILHLLEFICIHHF